MKEILFTLSFKKLTRIYLNKISLLLFLPAIQCNPLKRNENILCIIQQGLKDSIKLPTTHSYWGFTSISAGKESTCNAGDPGSISGSGRSAGEGIGYPLQFSWASLVAQLVKNLPSMLDTWVRSLGWEDPREKGKAIHSSILAWRIS